VVGSTCMKQALYAEGAIHLCDQSLPVQPTATSVRSRRETPTVVFIDEEVIERVKKGLFITGLRYETGGP